MARRLAASIWRNWKFIAVVIIIAAAVYVALPGRSQFILRSDNEAANAGIEVVRTAVGHANARYTLANVVRAYLDKDFDPPNGITQQLGPDSVDELVQFVLKSKIETELFKGELNFDLLKIAQGFIEKVLARPGSILTITKYLGPPDRHINLSAHKLSTKTIDDAVDEADFRKRLAHYVGVTVFDRDMNCQKDLCSAELPIEISDLTLIAQVLDTVRAGYGTSLCDGLTDELKCITKAREALSSMTSTEKASEFIKLLVELKTLQIALQGNSKTVVLTTALKNIDLQMRAIRGSRYLMEKMSSDSSIQHLMNSLGWSGLDLSAEFLATLPYYLKAREYRKYNQREKALEYYAKVKSPPAWFRPLLDRANLTAKLRNKSLTISDAIELIDLVIAERSDPAYLYHLTVGSVITRTVERFAGNLDHKIKNDLQKTSSTHWTDALAYAPPGFDNVTVRLEAARAKIAFSDTTKGVNELELAIKDLRPLLARDGFTEKKPDPKSHFATSAASTILFRLDRYDEAKRWLTLAALAYKANVCIAATDPNLKSWRAQRKDESEKWLREMKKKVDVICP